MKGRDLPATFAVLQVAAPLPLRGATGGELHNPYAADDWDQWKCLYSMPQQHPWQTDASRDGFVGMTCQHLAFQPSRRAW